MSFGPLHSLLSALALVALLASVKACTADSAKPPTVQSASASKPAQPKMDGAVPEGLDRFEGTVTQNLAAGHYSYMQVTPADGRAPVWLATMGKGQDSGTAVAITAYSAVQDFHSRRLGRRFDQVLFGQARPATP